LLGNLVSEMTYCVSSGTLNSTQSLARQKLPNESVCDNLYINKPAPFPEHHDHLIVYDLGLCHSVTVSTAWIRRSHFAKTSCGNPF